MTRIRLAAAVLSLLTMLPAGAVEIDEWQVPWVDTRPRDPFVADEQASTVWFVGQKGHYLGRLDTESGEFSRIDLEDGAGPHNLILDADGQVWYAGNRAAHIGRVDPQDGQIHRIAMPDGHPRDPHTLISDGRGHIWFTAQGANAVGRLHMATERVDVVDIPRERSRPYGIIVDGDGRPWMTLFGSNHLATVDPDTLQLEQVVLPRADARPRRLALGPNGHIWYVDYAQGYLGRLDPESREVSEWRAPAALQSRPYAMAADDQGRIWFAETGPQPNRLVAFDVASEAFEEPVEIPSGGGTVRHMVFHAPTASLWFGTDMNTIGRARLD